MWQRREFFKKLGALSAGTIASSQVFSIPATYEEGRKHSTTFGIISDLHHLQFGKSEEPRLKAFMDEVLKKSSDFIVQCGDFCRPQQSEGIMAEWNRFKGPKYHVLGNHDMDVCSKEVIMELWGMERPYHSFDFGGYHYVVMDRNFLRNKDGLLVDYNNSNWGPFSAPFRSFTDQPQLAWLKKDLADNDNPVIIFMHQPVFLSDFFDELGNANEILAIFDEVNYTAKKDGKNSSIAAVFMGHDHDDRYAERNGVHYFLVNSASYVYTNGGAHFYKDALFAFVTIKASGQLIIEGRATTFRDNVEDSIKARFPTSITNRTIKLRNKIVNNE